MFTNINNKVLNNHLSNRVLGISIGAHFMIPVLFFFFFFQTSVHSIDSGFMYLYTQSLYSFYHFLSNKTIKLFLSFTLWFSYDSIVFPLLNVFLPNKLWLLLKKIKSSARKICRNTSEILWQYHRYRLSCLF